MAGTVWRAGCGNYFRSPGGRIATQLPFRSGWYVRRTRHLDLGDYHAVAPPGAS
jgi:hypothetical protein